MSKIKVNNKDKIKGFYTILIESKSPIICYPNNEYVVSDDVLNTLTKHKIKFKKFHYRCLCFWSKDDKYGFIPVIQCPIHKKSVEKTLKKAVPMEV